MNAWFLVSSDRFPCEHIVCNICLPGISKGADETVLCPKCRARCPRDDVELVHMTETQRWDDLLKVAQAWDAFDANTRGDLETSEEEAEENFLTDGDGMYVIAFLPEFLPLDLSITTGLKILRRWEESRSLKIPYPKLKYQHHRLYNV